MSANEYRTKWLLAHNALHELVNKKGKKKSETWKKYLADLGNSKKLSKIPA